MTLFQLEVFLKVVATKSFTRAGEQIGLSQSAVSQAVAALESELNVKLLNRHRNGVSLTEVGERITSLIKDLLTIKSKIVNEASGITEIETGTIRIASISGMAAKLLPGMISSFKQRFPGVDVTLYEGSYEEVKNWIKLSVVDVGLIAEEKHEFEFFPLLQDKMVVIIPEQHPLSHQSDIKLKEIAKEPFILPKECDRLLRTVFKEQGVTPSIPFEVSDIATIIAMVQEGVGNTILPELAIPSILPKVHVSYLSPQVYQNLGLEIRSSDYMSSVLTAFIHEAQEFTKNLSLRLFNSYHSVITKKG
ncbi:LysR family transcriptional regulator [Bacillus sp. BRMEA1]|uniref:LysR family transcriptional regulator n=1 Tax=Neobacillus endophyticus TaxID=2738405 RepID=UPI0015663367|nr:LysR family transcriptional regulator [Neobacillus endophyticus]NRD76821.1 LysR family transcriptional regulator [Neobacillus endophyticus]